MAKKMFSYLFLALFLLSNFFGVFADEFNSGTGQIKESSIPSGSIGNETGTGKTSSGGLNNDSESIPNQVEDDIPEGQEQTGSGEQEETGTGETNSFSGEVEENIFSSKVIFQNPSYILEKDEENREFYTCDKEKEECKINFKFEGFLNSEKLTQSKIRCETSLGFESGEENKCNPTTIIFPEGESKVNYKIILKSDETLFKEGSFTIKNLEETGSGELNDDSEEVAEGQNGEETGTGEVEGESGIGEILEIPEIDLEIQSGGDFGSGNTIICRQKVDKTCKINLNLEKSFSGVLEEKYACFFDFGTGASFSFGTDKKCNPSYIDYGTGIFEIKTKIYEKNNENNFKEKIFILKNEEDLEENNEEESGTGNTEENKDFLVIYSFQSPTYFLEKEPNFGTGEIAYNCDRSKKECKLNLDFRPTFSGSLKERDFSCELNFGSGILTGEENKCNPNTVIIGTGKTEISYKIENKFDENYYKTGSFFVVNNGYLEGNNSSSGGGNSNSEEFQDIEENPKIGIQSGLSENLICDKKICSINLIYKKTNKNLSCSWDFGDGDIGKTNTKTCNPGYVRFGPGKHKIKLKVYDKKNENNFKESFLEFENIYKIDELKARITLQGRLAKYKILKGNKLICNGVKICSVNLTGAESTSEIKKYYWDFGNGETFEGKNPKSVKFKAGKYEIKLKVIGENSKTSEASFFVEVLEEKMEIEEGNLDFLSFLDNYYKNLSFVKKEEFLRNKREELKKLFKLYHRKNKKFSTAYGKYKAYENILIRKKGKNFLGLFYDKEFLVKASESSKFKQRLPYDMAGKFILKSYILDKNLGVFDSGVQREFEVFEKDVENSSPLNSKKQTSPLSPLLKGEGKEQIIIPKIEIQGRIGKNKKLKDKKITCFGACSLNFDGRKSSGNFVEIVWDFGNGKKGGKKNPKSVKYKNPGKYKVSLKLRDKFGEIYEDNFLVEVKKKIKKKRGRKKSRKSKKKKDFGPVKLEIGVQGRLGKNKILGENKITCLQTCSVNFDGRKSSGAYKKLTWDFGNGETFSGENPKYIKYKKPGKYRVRLQALDYKGKSYEKVFEVEVLEKPDSKKVAKGKDFNLKVGGISEKFNTGVEFKETENKNGKYFIFIIIVIILSGSFILLKRYKIL